MKTTKLIPLSALALLAACGGGGGASAGDTSARATPAATAPMTTVAEVVPGAGMTWSTTNEVQIVVNLHGSNGGAADGAAVRVFSASRTSPQDGSALEAPVPVSLLDTGVSDAGGQAVLALRLPATVGEVLVVATLGDARASQGVKVDAAALTLDLTLAR